MSGIWHSWWNCLGPKGLDRELDPSSSSTYSLSLGPGLVHVCSWNSPTSSSLLCGVGSTFMDSATFAAVPHCKLEWEERVEGMPQPGCLLPWNFLHHANLHFTFGFSLTRINSLPKCDKHGPCPSYWQSLFPSAASWVTFLWAFCSSRLPPEWPIKLCLHHSQAFLIPNSQFFRIPPTKHHPEAENHGWVYQP